MGVSPQGLAHDEPPQLFANRQLALFAGGTWNLALFQKSGVDFGVAAFPYFQGGKVLTPTGKTGLSASPRIRRTRTSPPISRSS